MEAPNSIVYTNKKVSYPLLSQATLAMFLHATNTDTHVPLESPWTVASPSDAKSQNSLLISALGPLLSQELHPCHRIENLAVNCTLDGHLTQADMVIIS